GGDAVLPRRHGRRFAFDVLLQSRAYRFLERRIGLSNETVAERDYRNVPDLFRKISENRNSADRRFELGHSGRRTRHRAWVVRHPESRAIQMDLCDRHRRTALIDGDISPVSPDRKIAYRFEYINHEIFEEV